MPPSVSGNYAQQHDSAVWKTFCAVAAAQQLQEDQLAQQVATLPGRLGGMGLRAAQRTAPVAYWASWVTALPVVREKYPALATMLQSHLAAGEASPAASVQEAARSHAVVQAAGTSHIPTWAEACAGAKPPPPPDGTDPADFDRGWQCHASSFSEQLFLERVVQPNCDRARLTLLLSQSGGAASAWLRAVPSEPAFTLRPWPCSVKSSMGIRRASCLL